jgi:hypothetical protein
LSMPSWRFAPTLAISLFTSCLGDLCAESIDEDDEDEGEEVRPRPLPQGMQDAIQELIEAKKAKARGITGWEEGSLRGWSVCWYRLAPAC